MAVAYKTEEDGVYCCGTCGDAFRKWYKRCPTCDESLYYENEEDEDDE